MDKLDITDKHKLLLPVGNYQTVNSAALKQQIPDFPANLMMVGMFGCNRRDISWRLKDLPPDLGSQVGQSAHIFERELDMHVEVSLSDILATQPEPTPAVALLQSMRQEVMHAVEVLQSA